MVFVLLKMAFDVWRVPDYQYGKAYFSYSPDGAYKAMYVFPQTPASTIPLLIMDTVDQSVRAIILLPADDWGMTGGDDIWSCGKRQKSACTAYRLDPKTELPPSPWQRAHAWLTVNIKRLEQPQLQEIPMD